MKGENPFTLTFGQKPVEFISRTDQIGKIINTFDMENPSNMVYMIAGVRGSGKTVSLAVIDILPKFDEELTVYAYEKIWSELSELDRKIVYIISQGVNKTGDIRESLGVSPQLLNTYRKRLMERGVVDGSRHGELTLALPRFEEYINMYCEVTI